MLFDYRVKPTARKITPDNSSTEFLANLMAKQDEFNRMHRDLLKKVEPYIPDDVRNHPRFGLMTKDELKQAVRESYERTEESHRIFRTQYLGEWVEGDKNEQ